MRLRHSDVVRGLRRRVVIFAHFMRPMRIYKKMNTTGCNIKRDVSLCKMWRAGWHPV